MNLPQIQKILQEFEKQSDIMDMKEEIMNEAIDDAMEDEGDEEERLVSILPHFIDSLCIYSNLRFIIFHLPQRSNCDPSAGRIGFTAERSTGWFGSSICFSIYD